MIAGEEVLVTLEFIDALEALDIPYHLGGSFASSIHGEPRQTRDADVAADLPLERVDRLVATLAPRFYLDADAIRDAILRGTSFNLIHYETMFKIDVFMRGTSAYDAQEFARHQLIQILDDPPRSVFCATPEDTILRKLLWYRQGGEVASQQLRDVMGVLEVQGSRLGVEYLRKWADEIGVRDLLDDALAAAG